MMRHLFEALDSDNLQHASLVTGTKQYLGSFEAYGSGRIETPFRESERACRAITSTTPWKTYC